MRLERFVGPRSRRVCVTELSGVTLFLGLWEPVVARTSKKLSVET